MKIEIKNWVKYNPKNSYKTMPWFKCYNTLFDDQKLFGLSNDQKWLWICLLCLAARQNSTLIHMDIDYLSFIFNCKIDTLKSTLQHFENKGLIVIKDPDKILIGSVDDPDKLPRKKERKKERKREGANAPDATAPEKEIPYQFFVDGWNSITGGTHKVTTLSQTRKNQIRIRWNEKPDSGYWQKCFSKINGNPWLLGNNNRNWKIKFDWLLENDTNHVKVSEGYYDNDTNKRQQQSPSLD